MANMFIQKDPGIERRRRLAASMMSRPTPSNMTHWSQGLGDVAQKALGAYMSKQADTEAEERQSALGETMQQAATAEPWIDPDTQKPEATKIEQMARVLAQNPDTAPMAMQMRMQDAQSKDKKTQALELASAKAKAGGGPSSIQEWNVYNAMSPEDQERFLTMKRANRLYDVGGEFRGMTQTTQEPTVSLEKTLKPGERPEVRGQQAAAKTAATQFETAKGKWRASETKLLSTLKSSKARQEVLDTTIEKAKTLLSKWTTSYGGMLANVPATESKRLSNLLDTIKANVGFSELQSLRDNSPTGGALGQVSEMENRLLQSVLGSLDQVGDMGDLAATLDTVSTQRLSAIQRMEEAYNMDKGTYGTRIKMLKPGEDTGEPSDVGEMSDEELMKSLGL